MVKKAESNEIELLKKTIAAKDNETKELRAAIAESNVSNSHESIENA
jgi:hypothetical protein